MKIIAPLQHRFDQIRFVGRWWVLLFDKRVFYGCYIVARRDFDPNVDYLYSQRRWYVTGGRGTLASAMEARTDPLYDGTRFKDQHLRFEITPEAETELRWIYDVYLPSCQP